MRELRFSRFRWTICDVMRRMIGKIFSLTLTLEINHLIIIMISIASYRLLNSLTSENNLFLYVDR